jgi:hypothetical protein
VTATVERTDIWLPLLQRLTAEVGQWAVWKRADPAFTAPEDVDAVAPLAAWPDVERVFRTWAAASGYSVVVCRHIPWTLNLFALIEDGRSLLQLEVKDRSSFRGAVQFYATDLLPVTEQDPRGFRALRPGAEAALKLTLHGLRKGGRPNHAALAEHGVIDGLRADREAAVGLATASRLASRPLVAAIDAAAAGGWDRRALITVEIAAGARALTQPHVAARRWWFRRVVRPRCPVLQTVYAGGRRIDGDIDAWLAEARRAHTVVVAHAS